MTLNLLTKYSVTTTDVFDDQFWNAFLTDIVLVLSTLQEATDSLSEAEAQLIETALFRVNEVLLPAFQRVQDYQEIGFLTCRAVTGSSVSFTVGETTIGLEPGVQRDLFQPTPYLSLSRETSPGDFAIARTIAFNRATGALTVEILTVTGGAGPHSDTVVGAGAGAVFAFKTYFDAALAARDHARDWAEKASGQDVDGVGTRSAKHHAGVAASAASSATDASAAASAAAGVSAAKRDEAVGGADSASAAASVATTKRDEAVAAAAAAAASAASIAGGPVASVNGRSGVVVLSSADIPGLAEAIAGAASVAYVHFMRA